VVLRAPVVVGGADDEEGIGGDVVTGSFSVGWAMALPLPSPTIAPLLAPFA
jgi:hypothetical protein